MAEPQDTIRRVNDERPMSAEELVQARRVLDRFAPKGKQDVLQARMRVNKMMAAQGVEVPPIEAGPAGPTAAGGVKREPKPGDTAKGVAVIVGVLALVGGCFALVGGSDDDDADGGTESSADEIGASVICEQFVEDRLRSPGSAEFASYPDQVVTGGPTEFVVQAYVDSENGFGALLRIDYTCTVSSTDGDSWTLVDLVTSED